MARSEVRPMHAHLQGLILLVSLAILGLLVSRMAGPSLSGFFDEDGAVYAEPADEETAEDAVEEVPLTGDEVARLQRHLTTLGFDPGPVDGIPGDQTDTAVDDALAEYLLAVTTTDRELLDYLDSLISALDAAADADATFDEGLGEGDAGSGEEAVDSATDG